MTKEEVIKEAYGKHWDEVWEFVDDNGWCTRIDYSNSISERFNHRPLNEMGFKKEDDLLDTGMCTKTGNAIWRPKALKGIETNNGWIKIESEDDLPKKSGDYKVVKSGKPEQATFIGKNRWFCDGRDFPNQTASHGITHWKNIEKEELPIY